MSFVPETITSVLKVICMFCPTLICLLHIGLFYSDSCIVTKFIIIVNIDVFIVYLVFTFYVIKANGSQISVFRLRCRQIISIYLSISS